MKPSKVTFITFALLLFSQSAWAGDKMSATIHIAQTVHIGATELAPGDYKMTWTQSGSNAEVTISRDKRVIATVLARVAQVRSGYDSPALHTVSNTLIGVDLPKVSFSFESENAVSPSSGN